MTLRLDGAFSQHVKDAKDNTRRVEKAVSKARRETILHVIALAWECVSDYAFSPGAKKVLRRFCARLETELGDQQEE